MDPNLSPPDPNLSSPYLVHLAYIACGVLIIFYAWDRFSTPASNRSSTRRALYRWGCAGYVVSALGLFVVLSVLLQVGAWRTMLLGPGSDKLSLPPPFIATLGDDNENDSQRNARRPIARLVPAPHFDMLSRHGISVRRDTATRVETH